MVELLDISKAAMTRRIPGIHLETHSMKRRTLLSAGAGPAAATLARWGGLLIDDATRTVKSFVGNRGRGHIKPPAPEENQA